MWILLWVMSCIDSCDSVRDADDADLARADANARVSGWSCGSGSAWAVFVETAPLAAAISLMGMEVGGSHSELLFCLTTRDDRTNLALNNDQSDQDEAEGKEVESDLLETHGDLRCFGIGYGMGGVRLYEKKLSDRRMVTAGVQCKKTKKYFKGCISEFGPRERQKVQLSTDKDTTSGTWLCDLLHGMHTCQDHWGKKDYSPIKPSHNCNTMSISVLACYLGLDWQLKLENGQWLSGGSDAPKCECTSQRGWFEKNHTCEMEKGPNHRFVAPCADDEKPDVFASDFVFHGTREHLRKPGCGYRRRQEELPSGLQLQTLYEAGCYCDTAGCRCKVGCEEPGAKCGVLSDSEKCVFCCESTDNKDNAGFPEGTLAWVAFDADSEWKHTQAPSAEHACGQYKKLKKKRTRSLFQLRADGQLDSKCGIKFPVPKNKDEDRKCCGLASMSSGGGKVQDT